jgi:hypothetical protein
MNVYVDEMKRVFCMKCNDSLWKLSWFHPGFIGVRVTRSLIYCVCLVDRCLFFCTFSFWPLHCLFFDLRILIAPLVSSNSSYAVHVGLKVWIQWYLINRFSTATFWFLPQDRTWISNVIFVYVISGLMWEEVVRATVVINFYEITCTNKG